MEGGGGEMWRDNITCVKCRRVCAHRNMFNGFYDCREGCVRCVFFFFCDSDVCTACVQTAKCLWCNVDSCWTLVCFHLCLDTVYEYVYLFLRAFLGEVFDLFIRLFCDVFNPFCVILEHVDVFIAYRR